MDSPSSARRALWVGLAVLGIFALALFLRSYWNLEPAHPDADTFVLSGGSDPYYHKRAVDCIVFGDVNGFCAGQKAWTHFLHDPLLNYPLGSINPNPPLYEWSIAVMGLALDPVAPGGLDAAVWYATIWSPAIWGALTVIPIFFLGRELWGNKAGLIGAFFWAVSTAAIDHTALGDADHDAIVMFFVTLAMLFYVRMLHTLRGEDVWVTSWSNGSAIASGIGRIFRERPALLGFAGLSGMSLAAVALMWKGFPYVIGIILVYGGIMLLVDNWRNRDATGLFVGTSVVLLLGIFVAWPYYSVANLLAANMYAPLAMLVAWLVAGFILVPTRDLPFILVIPAALLAAVVGAVATYFLSPVAWRSLFNATVYFRQSALYRTIAEAHPADFNQMVFGIGPVIFLLAVVGIGWLAWTLRKNPRRGLVFALIWAVVALYMAQSAVRFLYNAVPILGLVAAAFTARILEWVDFQAIRKEFAGAGSFWGGLRRGVRGGHVLTAFLITFLLVLPQVVLAFDAAVPATVESKWQKERLVDWLAANTNLTKEQLEQRSVDGQGGLRELYVKERLKQEDEEDTAENRRSIEREFVFFVERRLGAFGQGFLDPSWQRSLAFLDRYSSQNWSGPVTERPAFLAWWDYGHWAIAVGKHPAVADNFQNGYQFAANFLLAQNETHAIQLLAARLMPCVGGCGPQTDAKAAAQLTVVKNVLPNATAQTVSDLLAWRYVRMTDEQAVRLVDAMEKATGKKIRFFTVDGRMMPLDDPSTSTFIDRSSIYYAPVVLKGDDPEKYLITKYTASGCPRTELTEKELEACLRSPASASAQVTGTKLEYTRAFVNSMYYRAFVGPAPAGAGATITNQQILQAYFSAQPGSGLKHFRAIYADSEVRILEYYPGVNLTGRVLDDAGNPVAGATVTIYDDLNNVKPGIQHGSARTGADGRYTVLAPFSTGDGIFLDVVKDNVRVANATVVVPHGTARELGANGVYGSQTVPDLKIARGTVKGRVFLDVNQNGTRDASETASLAGLVFSIGGQNVTVDANGNYTVTTLAGEAVVTTSNATYAFRTGTRVRVEPNATSTQDVGAIYRSVNLSGVLRMSDRPTKNFTAPFPTLQFLPDASIANNTARPNSATAGVNGTYQAAITPGAYKVKLATPYNYREDGFTVLATYELVETALVVPVAGPPMIRNYDLTPKTT